MGSFAQSTFVSMVSQSSVVSVRESLTYSWLDKLTVNKDKPTCPVRSQNAACRTTEFWEKLNLERITINSVSCSSVRQYRVDEILQVPTNHVTSGGVNHSMCDLVCPFDYYRTDLDKTLDESIKYTVNAVL